MPSWWILLTAFIATPLLTIAFARRARRVGLVDIAGGHRTHVGQVPLVGGVGMFCVFMFAVLLLQQPLHDLRPFFAAAALLVIVGVLDDLRDLSSPARFAAQIAAASLMVLWGGVVLRDLGNLVGKQPLALGDWRAAFTVFSVVGVINAFNMIDGIDGLAGGIALVATVLLALASFGIAAPPTTAVLMTFGATVAGFLTLNLRYPGHPQATVFMGDAGSTFLGFTLAWFLVDLSQGQARAIAPITAIWILMLPLMDTVCIMIRRAVRGRSPFRADRGHLHHLLQSFGLTPARVVSVILLASATLGTLGIAAERAGVAEHHLFRAFVAAFLIYCFGIEMAWRHLRNKGRG